MGIRSMHFRAHERRPVQLGALIRHDGAGWVRDARLLDLSPAGAGLELGEIIEPEARLVLEILAPTLWDPLVLRALVAWSSPTETGGARVGVGFVHDNPEALFGLFEVLGLRK